MAKKVPKKVGVEVCKDIPRQVAKQVPVEECHDVPREVCHQKPVEVPRQECRNVPEKVSWPVALTFGSDPQSSLENIYLLDNSTPAPVIS